MIKQIREDMVKYMKAKSVDELSAVRMLIGAIEKREKEVRRDLTNDEVIAIVGKEIKGYKETASYYAEDSDTYKKLMTQIDTISVYLPQQMSTEDVAEIIKSNMSDNKNDVMKAVMPLIKGKFDGKEASRMIAEMTNV